MIEHPSAGHAASVSAPGAAAPAACPRGIEGLIECELEDELLVYAPQRNAVFALNPSSRKVWERCRGRETPEEIAASLARQLGVPDGALVEDVSLAIAQFHALGLLAEAEPGHRFST